MSKYYCNPLNISYKYQILEQNGSLRMFREAADPSLIFFKGQYFLFPSMSGGFWTSCDFVDWKFHEFINAMPVYDYAPDIQVIGDYVYFCASKNHGKCHFYRSKDPLIQPFEKIEGSFSFWDPALFYDDDGKLYLYWGCSNKEPIWGVQLDPETMRPTTRLKALISQAQDSFGHEYAWGKKPFIEGAWMTKYHDRYYLQYASPGTEYPVYNDGVYTSAHPLGPFRPAKNNPFSYKPGGFITGAGHGSTVKNHLKIRDDILEGWWHISTMHIGCHHPSERRLGLWKAGFDSDGELFCDQRYGDWPTDLSAPAFSDPPWMLLSRGKHVSVSSGTGAPYVTDENIRTWWRGDRPADGTEAARKDPEWIQVDLGKIQDIRAIQVNFADQLTNIPKPDFWPSQSRFSKRYIDMTTGYIRWILEVSKDGNDYHILTDKSNAQTDLPHDLMIYGEGLWARYIRLKILQVPYGAKPCISGLRIFGNGHGKLPEKVRGAQAQRLDDLTLAVWWEPSRDGHEILWGYSPEKLYHSWTVYDVASQEITALVKGEPVFVRVDTFNENGITHGDVIAVN